MPQTGQRTTATRLAAPSLVNSQLVAARGEDMKGGHRWHTSADAAAEADGSACVPAGQAVQAEVALMGAKEPAGQTTQAWLTDATEKVPGSQATQAALSRAPALVEKRPAPQPAHADAPAMLLKDPGGHCGHTSVPTAPVKVPDAQAMQSDLRLPPEADANFPVGHKEHSAEPTRSP